MKKDVIFDIFDFLKRRGIAENESDFSIDWLGQCDSYYRGLRFKKTEPTLGVIAICGSRLQKAGEAIMASPPHQHVAEQFLALSARCHQLVNEDAVELDLM